MSTASASPRLAAVVAAAAIATLVLDDRGLLVPAGSADGLIRGVAGLAGVGAVALLLQRDGPLDGARSLAAVGAVATVLALATISWSPVTLSESTPDVAPDGGSPAEGAGTVVLDSNGPGSRTGPTLVLPPGGLPAVEGGAVVVRFPDGNAVVLGTSGSPGGPGAPTTTPGAAGVPGTPPPVPAEVSVVAGVPSRSDGGAIGGDTGLGGTTLQTADGYRVFVADGVLLPVPDVAPDASGPGGVGSEGEDVILAVLLACFALLAFAPPVVRRFDRIAAEVLVVAAEETPDAEPAASMEAGLADVLGAMLADPDPRTAVIGAYARLLAALAEVGFARRAEETPHEHLWRSLGPLGVRRAPLHRLAELFVRARFTPHPVTEGHRQSAINALADAVADLRLAAADVDDALATSQRAHDRSAPDRTAADRTAASAVSA